MTKRGIVKLGDFGISRVLSNTRSKAKTIVGTPYYLSPEIIRSEGYNFKSDIWSLGVLLYEMAALVPPFNAESLHKLAQKILSGKYAPLPPNFSKDTTNLIASLLQKDPAMRPSIHQILNSPQVKIRIKKFLSGDSFKDEFSHTLLHNQNVFEEFQKKNENEKLKAEEARIAKEREL
jgi:NIMA (never in mitosis gene a)-related kinase